MAKQDRARNALMSTMSESIGASVKGVPPRSIVLGSGFDLRTQTVCITAVTGKKNSKPLDWKPSYAIDYMSTYEQVTKFFSLDVSARYSGAAGGASASVAIVNQCSLERSKVIIAVSVRAITGSEFYDEPELKADVVAALRTTAMPDVVSKYGGSYVRSIGWGGELACLLVVSASSTESIDSLRARIEAEGFGAHGSVDTTSKITKLSTTNDIKVIYSQSGGAAADGTNGSIVQTDAAGLLKRMEEFVKELRATNSLTGSVVPMEVEFWPLKKTSNWPSDVTGDPERPYPPDIESIAQTIAMLEDRRERTKQVVDRKTSIAPSSIAAAHAALDYLDTIILTTGNDLRKLMANPKAQASVLLESMFQYRVRNLLQVEFGDHKNAGLRLDAKSPDKAQLAAFMLGPVTFPDITPWPEVTFRTWWGYHGENVGAFGGPQWRCSGGESHDPYVESAYPLSGKNPAVNDGIFCLVSVTPDVKWHQPGGHCGYQPMVIVAADVKKPDAPQMAPLPALPSTHFDPPAHEEAAPAQVDDGVWVLQFVVHTGPAGTTCAYNISVTETSATTKKTRVKKLPTSYWYTLKGGPLNLTHEYGPEDGWTPSKFTVELGLTYILTPDYAALAAGQSGQTALTSRGSATMGSTKSR